MMLQLQKNGIFSYAYKDSFSVSYPMETFCCDRKPQITFALTFYFKNLVVSLGWLVDER